MYDIMKNGILAKQFQSRKRKRLEKSIADFVLKRIKETEVKMSIVVKDTKPIFSVPRRLQIKEREIADKQIEV